MPVTQTGPDGAEAGVEMRGTVLVAGGVTILGQHLARWAAENPATHVLLPVTKDDEHAPEPANLTGYSRLSMSWQNLVRQTAP